MAQTMTIDFIDQVTRITNQRIADEIREAFDGKYKPPTLSPAQTRTVLEVAAELVPADAPDALTVQHINAGRQIINALYEASGDSSGWSDELAAAVSLWKDLLTELKEATE